MSYEPSMLAASPTFPTSHQWNIAMKALLTPRSPIDPTTGRPFGNHGTAEDAIAFVLENPDDAACETEAFLRYWDQGDLRSWPEYYRWLAKREAAALPASTEPKAAHQTTKVVLVLGVVLVLVGFVRWASERGLNHLPSPGQTAALFVGIGLLVMHLYYAPTDK